MNEMRKRVAQAIAAAYDGYADPVETPENWARAVSATDAAIAAMREPNYPGAGFPLMIDAWRHAQLVAAWAMIDEALAN